MFLLDLLPQLVSAGTARQHGCRSKESAHEVSSGGCPVRSSALRDAGFLQSTDHIFPSRSSHSQREIPYRPHSLLRQCFHIASSQNQIGPVLDKLQQTNRYPAVDMAAASTELAGLPECSAETLPPHPHFHLQASCRAGMVFSAAGVRIVNGYALLYVTEPDR